MKAFKYTGIILLLIAPLTSFVFFTDEAVSWYHIEEAQEMGADNPKPVFIDFTATWCSWCKKMDNTTFSDEKIAEMLNNDFYAVKVDYDSKEKFDYQGKKYTGKQLAQQFGITGLPTMIFVSRDFKKSDQLVGYQKAKQFLGKLNKYKSW